jgi:chromosome segregation ATPase
LKRWRREDYYQGDLIAMQARYNKVVKELEKQLDVTNAIVRKCADKSDLLVKRESEIAMLADQVNKLTAERDDIQKAWDIARQTYAVERERRERIEELELSLSEMTEERDRFEKDFDISEARRCDVLARWSNRIATDKQFTDDCAKWIEELIRLQGLLSKRFNSFQESIIGQVEAVYAATGNNVVK